MSLGEIPGGNLRAYYKLEGLTDSSGNGYTLTNNNSVAFNPAKFANGADFGSSGTNKGLTTTSNVLTSNRPSNYMVRLRFKLNSTTNTSNKLLFNIITGTTYAGGFTYMSGRYSITSPNITINGFCDDITAIASVSLPLDTNWYYCDFFRFGDTSLFVVQVQSLTDRKILSANTAIGSSFSQTGVTNKLSIGNNYPLTNQGYVIIDQFIIDENIYAVSSATSGDRVRLRTREIFGE